MTNMTVTDTENCIQRHNLKFQLESLVLRELFLKIVKNSSCKGDVDKYLHLFRKDRIQKLRDSNRIGRASFLVLFPKKGKRTNVDKWDLSLLSIVIRCCCCNNNALREDLVEFVKTEFRVDTLLRNECDDYSSRNHELTDDQNDQLFPSGGKKRDIRSMDLELYEWIVFKFGDEALKIRFYLIMLKHIKREIQLAGSVDDFLKRKLQSKDILNAVLSEMNLPSLRQFLENHASVSVSKFCLEECRVIIQIAYAIETSLSEKTVKAVSTIQESRKEFVHNRTVEPEKDIDLKWEAVLNGIYHIVKSEVPELASVVEKKVNDIKYETMVHTPLEHLSENTVGYEVSDPLTLKSSSSHTSKGDGRNSPKPKILECFYGFDINECCQENGRKSLTVKSMCDLISNLLCNCSPKILRVWPAYQPAKEEDIRVVFVAITEDDQIEDIRIPPPLDRFEIIYRVVNAYSQEETGLMKCTNCKERRFTDIEHNQLGTLLRKYSKQYMNEHQNLNIMTASPLKSVKYGQESAEIKHETCVVFYVENKGLIPLAEDEFPKFLGDFPTDIRESSFELFSPKNYHPTLKMGCLIGSGFDSDGNGISGTLGAFVDLPDGSVGCFTSAHAILQKDLMDNLIQEKVKTYVEATNTHVFQPKPSQDNNHFGHVIQAVYKEGGHGETGLEAALIKITDPSRYPVSAEFPEQYCEHGGLSQTSRFKSGKILTNIPNRSQRLTVLKFGAETCLTRGAFKLFGSSVRTSTLDAKESFGVCLHNQIEMTTVGSSDEVFAKEGDSGAVVLLPNNGNENDLRAIGIITGGNKQGTIYVTPIVDILKAFGYDKIGSLKSFPLTISPDTYVPMETEEQTTQGTLFRQGPPLVQRSVSVESFDEFKSDVGKKFQKIDDGQRKTNDTLDSMHELLKQRENKPTTCNIV